MRLLSEFVGLLGAWQSVGLMLGLLLVPVLIVIALRAGTVKLGPLEIRRLEQAVDKSNKAASDLDKLSIAMAKSRITELEITTRQFLSTLSEDDKKLLRGCIDDLKKNLMAMEKD